jgi:hypothetical protein
MVGWGTESTDIENPQKVASSEGEELFVGTFPSPRPMLRVRIVIHHEHKLM